MKSTKKLIISLTSKKRNLKKTTIGWKTFNSKQIYLMEPKLKKLIGVIDLSIQKMIKLRQEKILKLLTLSATMNNQNIITSFEDIHNANLQMKANLYSSFSEKKVNILEKTRTIINTKVPLTERNKQITELMNYYLYLSTLFLNVNRSKVGVVSMPVARTTYTVLRSPHADKKAREQFAKEIYNTKIVITQYVSIMKYLDKIINSYTKSFISAYKYNII